MSGDEVSDHGLSKVERYYNNYGCRARELKDLGQKVMAYLCAYVPVEIITAAGFVPLRVKGDIHEPITKGDSQLETIACPFIRSCFDISLKGRFDFCDGLVIAHACDSMARTYSIWRYSLGYPYCHFLNLPHTVRGPSMDFFKAELETFRISLERFAKKEISDKALAQAVHLYNENRAKVRELYEFRKSNPPLISGIEVTKVLVAGMGLPIEESNELMDEVLVEIRKGRGDPLKKLPRIMATGGTVDDIALINLIEESGANMVVDSVCVGTRDYWPFTDVTTNPIDGIADRYLRKINCPRTYREKQGVTYREDLEARFGDIGALIRDFMVDGVILYIYRYCDPFGFEVPAMKAYLESLNIPVLYLEDEYSKGSIGRLRTRIQAFIEMIG